MIINLIHHDILAQNDLGLSSEESAYNQSDTNARFQFIGPFENDEMIQQIGRIECITTDPLHDEVVYAGASSGGLWRCENIKDSIPRWECLTDAYFGMGVYDIAIHPEQTNIVYAVTGLHANGLLNHGDYSLGVFKTNDRGKTWTNVLAFLPEDQVFTTAIEMDPLNADIIFVLANKTVYKSIDAGNSWKDLMVNPESDVSFYNHLIINPKNTEVIAISGINGLYISTNVGVKWNRIKNLQHPDKTIIAIDYDTTGNLFAFYQEKRDRGTIVKSKNNGQDWITLTDNKYLTIRNYIYTLKIAPNGNIYAGGIRIYKSNDGGKDYKRQKEMHDDIRDIHFPGEDDKYGFMATDGGVVMRINSEDNNGWYSCNGNLSVSQAYSVSIAEQYPELIFSGTHDCGTLRNNNKGWNHISGSDGGSTLLDPFNSSYVYAAYGSSRVSLGLSKNSGDKFKNIADIATHNSPVIHHPVDSGTVYLATRDSIPGTPYKGGVVRKLDNYGEDWKNYSEVKYGDIFAIAVSESNPRLAYFAKYHAFPPSTALYKTRNNGIIWKEILYDQSNGKITDIVIDSADVKKLWISFANFNTANKVWYSKNGGRNWSNYSRGLPNVPVNKIIMDKRNRTLYAGTHAGIYSRKKSANRWSLVDEKMPEVLISDLKINYITSELFVATYGRGIWKIKL
jgi:photosystem II stability/assembly factor-like uncharacterized protein